MTSLRAESEVSMLGMIVRKLANINEMISSVAS